MIYCRFMVALAIAAMMIFSNGTTATAEPVQQSVQLKAGMYFPSSKLYRRGNVLEHTGIDLVYSIQPNPYAAVEVATGYYRAESYNGSISAVPLTVSASAILPLQVITVNAGGGVGTYYKMAGGDTELPPDRSEFSFGYHTRLGIEFPTSAGHSLLLDYRYVVVNQGKFKEYDIKHGGQFLYGGFALKF